MLILLYVTKMRFFRKYQVFHLKTKLCIKLIIVTVNIRSLNLRMRLNKYLRLTFLDL